MPTGSERRSAPAKPTRISVVAQAGEVAGEVRILRDHRKHLADDGGGGGDLFLGQLSLGCGVGADAGHGLRNAGIVGRHRAAGGGLQGADRGVAQVNCAGGRAVTPLAGQAGGDVDARAGQGLSPRRSYKPHRMRATATEARLGFSALPSWT